MSRGSGVRSDMRMLGYGAYEYLDFKPVVLDDGDCYSRCLVRAGELSTSIDLIRQAIDSIPEGEIEVKVKGNSYNFV